MSLLIGFLTFILVVNCLLLVLLVLVQLPKKEAGAGLAFGAGAVDTLIGAGSGNALTKMTKYIAGTFMGLAIMLAVLNAQRHQSSSRILQQELSKKSSAAPVFVPPTATPAPATGSLGTSAVQTAESLTAPPGQTSGVATPRLSPGPIPSKTAAPTSGASGLRILPDPVQPGNQTPPANTPPANPAPTQP
jgi:preprotein translocase subunit SecG